MPRLALALFLSVLPLPAQFLPPTAGIDATALDPGGFIYLAGTIGAADLPVTPSVLQPTAPANCLSSTCAFGYFAKVAPSGDALVWATYFYPAVYGTVTRIAVGKDGNLYVAFSAPSNTALPALGGYQSTPANIFLAEVSSDGRSLLAATYFGGAGDTIAALQLDATGSVYVAGTALSAGFPTTPGAYQRQPVTDPQRYCNGPANQFVAKFDQSLKTLVFSTLVGVVRMGRWQGSLKPVQAWHQLCGSDDGIERHARSDDSRPGALGGGVAIRQYRSFRSRALIGRRLHRARPAHSNHQRTASHSEGAETV